MNPEKKVNGKVITVDPVKRNTPRVAATETRAL
jgi:hypothetical protein